MQDQTTWDKNTPPDPTSPLDQPQQAHCKEQCHHKHEGCILSNWNNILVMMLPLGLLTQILELEMQGLGMCLNAKPTSEPSFYITLYLANKAQMWHCCFCMGLRKVIVMCEDQAMCYLQKKQEQIILVSEIKSWSTDYQWIFNMLTKWSLHRSTQNTFKYQMLEGKTARDFIIYLQTSRGTI